MPSAMDWIPVGGFVKGDKQKIGCQFLAASSFFKYLAIGKVKPSLPYKPVSIKLVDR